MFRMKPMKTKQFGAGFLVRAGVLLAAVVILIASARYAYRIGYGVFASEALTQGEGRTETITIEPNMTAQQVGNMLEDKKLIRDGLVYQIRAKIYEYIVQPGTYSLNSSMTLSQMIEIMTTAPADGSDNEASDEDTGEAGQ